MNRTLPASSSLRPALARSCIFACALISLLTMTACSSRKHKDDESSPLLRNNDRVPRDPVEDRVFYQGWRHPR